MKYGDKQLRCAAISTVVIPIIAIFANFSIWLSYGHPTFFNVLLTILFFMFWVILIYSSRYSTRALKVCAGYWLAVITTIGISLFVEISTIFYVPYGLLSIVATSPILGLTLFASIKSSDATTILLYIALAFLILISIVAIWQWRSNTK